MATKKTNSKAPAKEQKRSTPNISARIDRLVDYENSKVKAIASVNIGGAFAIHGLRVIDSQKGLFVQMPQNSFQKDGKTEYSDIFHPVTAEARSELNSKVLEAYEPKRKPAEIKWLEIEGLFEYDERDAEKMAAELEGFFAQDQIVISKKTKRGMGNTDIRPAIRSIGFEAQDSAVRVSAVISAQEPTLNPELLADALRQKKPALAPDFARFTRLETLDKNMEIYR